MTRHACKICVLTQGITLRDTFATEAELLEHIRREHMKPEMKAHPCAICHSTRGVDRVESFDTPAELDAHVAKDHPNWSPASTTGDRCFVLPDGLCVSPFECPHGPPDPDAVAALLNLPAATVPFIGTRSDGKIPVPELTRLLRTYGLRQLVLVAWDGAQEHVATDGATLGDADNAAEGGNFVKKALNWPPERWKHVDSTRVAKLLERVELLCVFLEDQIDEFIPSGQEAIDMRRLIADVRQCRQRGWRP
jgi:hypothetical protein